MQDSQVQLVRPPVTIGHGPSGRVSFRRGFLGSTDHRAFATAIRLFSGNLLCAVFCRSRAILGED